MSHLIDTHVHLDDPRLRRQLSQVLAYAAAMGVARMINIGHNMESSRASLALAREHENIWAAVGVHPHSAKDFTEEDMVRLENLAKDAKVVAIGEIGLDYHYDHSPRPVQREVFRRQLELARRLDLPVIIHQREAVQHTLECLAEFAPLARGGVMHCFSGSVEVMKSCLDLNLHIGLGGPVTFKNARKPKEVAAAVPLDRLLLETDCPYLAPHPHRGKTNQPGYLPLVAAEIAAIRGVSPAEIAEACWDNARALFRLPE